jgi:DNA adenine methylase
MQRAGCGFYGAGLAMAMNMYKLGAILNRKGNKQHVAQKLMPLFPGHNLYVELFFGAGGMFFNKPLSKYNFCNDLNDDVYNLFCVLQCEKTRQELYDYMELVPIHQTLLKYWLNTKETDAIKKAGRFLFLSNYTLYSNGRTIAYRASISQSNILAKINAINDRLKDVMFMNCDFREVINKIGFRREGELKEECFIYADPPYLETSKDLYNCTWNKDDVADLLEIVATADIRMGMTEFDHPFVLEQANKHNLNVYVIGEHLNISNRRTDIYISNYDVNVGLF